VSWRSLIRVVGRKATSTIKAVNRMASIAHHGHLAMGEMVESMNKYMEESARVRRLLSSRCVVFFLLINMYRVDFIYGIRLGREDCLPAEAYG
jgi:hypothetical protein